MIAASLHPLRLLAALERFFLTPATSRPFSYLRIGVATILLAQAVSVAPYFSALHGSMGFLQGSLGQSLNASSELPTLPALAVKLGVSPDRLVLWMAGFYVLSLLALLAGWNARIAAFIAWLAHTLLIGSGSATKYGADEFAQLALFYIALCPGEEFCLGKLHTGNVPRESHRFILRLLQFHLCVAYLATGIAKAQGDQWWNGEAIWRSLTLPLYRQFDFGWMAQVPWLDKLAGWGTLIVEGGYAIFIWPVRTRRLWIALIVGLHLGIALFLGLWVFGLLMTCLTVAAFGVSAEPRALVQTRLPKSNSVPDGR